MVWIKHFSVGLVAKNDAGHVFNLKTKQPQKEKRKVPQNNDPLQKTFYSHIVCNVSEMNAMILTIEIRVQHDLPVGLACKGMNILVHETF